jgi:signal transduction histidine kinase
VRTERQPIADSDLPAAMVMRGEEGLVEGVDYRGAAVLAAIRRIPDSPWGLVAKQDQAEIYAPLRRQEMAAGVTGALLLLSVTMGLAFLWRNREARFAVRALRERQEIEEQLKRIEWLLTRQPVDASAVEHAPSYGDLTELNTARTVVDSIGKQMLLDIVGDYLALLDTSVAVYERNGDYALGIFASDWCRFLDTASRALCNTDDNCNALACGKWHCHESCWSKAAKAAVDSGCPADVDCAGGLRLYAMPIFACGRVVGAISIGYGDPPRDPAKLAHIAATYGVDAEELLRLAEAYPTRPPFMIEMVKRRLRTSARLMGEIIERKEAEHQIELRNRDLETLIYVTSHDLREPLRAVTGFAQLLAERYAAQIDEKGKDFLRRIVGGAERLDRLLDDVLTLSRARRMDAPADRVNGRVVVDEALRRLDAQIKRLNAKVCVADDLPVLHVNALWATHAVSNLLANALKFTQPGLSPEIEIAGYREDGRAGLVVRDRGPGVAPEYSERIFLLFQRAVGREVEGTGAGLAIVRQVAERHGGRAWVKPRDGGGAEFFITFGLIGTDSASRRSS